MATEATDLDNNVPTETEPLLGRPGDAQQKPGAAMVANLYLGTGWIAEIGAVALVVLVWVAVFTNPLLPLFSPHPLLQSFGVLVLLQAILFLQPTASPEDKKIGARIHASLNLLSFLIFATGIALIESHKLLNNGEHFHSVHGYLGTITGVVLLIQYIFGFLMWGVPAVFGGVDKAKALWKYHRYSGYVLLLLVLATVISAADTPYVAGFLKVKQWSVIVSVVLILIGVFPRVQLGKLGWQRAH